MSVAFLRKEDGLAKTSTRLLAVLSLIAMLLAGCSSSNDEPENSTEASPEAQNVTGTATVFAAASLTESFTELKAAFEQANPGATDQPQFRFLQRVWPPRSPNRAAPTSSPRPTPPTWRRSPRASSTESRGSSPSNQLEIIVGPGNPKGIKGLAGLVNTGLRVILAAPQVPVGKYAREALDKAGVNVSPVSEAADVKGVVGPVTLGEADAGIVYATDVKAAGDKAEGVEIPEEQNVLAEYPIGVVKDSPNREVAESFLELVFSDRGHEILSDHGFLPA